MGIVIISDLLAVRVVQVPIGIATCGRIANILMGIFRNKLQLHGFSGFNGHRLALPNGNAFRTVIKSHDLGIIPGILLRQDIGRNIESIGSQIFILRLFLLVIGFFRSQNIVRCICITGRHVSILRSRVFRYYIRVFWQRSITNDSGFIGRMADLLDQVIHVSFNRPESSPAFTNLCHDTHMICRTVSVIVKKYDVTLLRGICIGTPVQTGVRQRSGPRSTVSSVRDSSLRDSGIVQAEGNKHGIPVAIGITIPLAVPCDTLHFAIFGDYIVLGAFLIPKLGPHNSSHIVSPNAGQLSTGNTTLPY